MFKRLKLEQNQCLESSYVEIWVEDGELHYIKRTGDGPDRQEENGVSRVTPEKFSETLEKIRIEEWEKQYYPCRNPLTGAPSWKLTYETTESKVKNTHGVDRFPDNWKEFSKAVKSVVGKYVDDYEPAICPRCGGKHTAEYLYGYPGFDLKLRDRMDAGEIILGGCCIDTVEVNGKTVDLNATNFCHDCKKDFGGPPVFINKKKECWEDYRDVATAIRFRVDQARGGYKEITITKNEDGALVHIDQFGIMLKKIDPETLKMYVPGDKQISEKEWNHILSRLYGDISLHEWKKTYTDLEVMDGESWELEVTMEGKRKRTYKGDNAYPPCWAKFIRLMKKCEKY